MERRAINYALEIELAKTIADLQSVEAHACIWPFQSSRLSCVSAGGDCVGIRH